LEQLHERLNILDIWVDPVDRYEAITRVEGFLRKGERPHTIFAANPEKNFSIPKDPSLYETFKNADLLLPDGIGMVWAAKILYGVKFDRVPGAEFIFNICDLCAEESYGIFVYGAKEDINKRAVIRLQQKIPGLKVVGRSHGYVHPSDMPDLIDRINESRAAVLILALGSPKQEKWFVANQHNLKHIKVCQCVGGTLDTIAGNTKRAPEILQKTALEWLYRLITQPSRIKRQKVLPLFAIAVIIAKVKQLFK
jgi:N-acetylglucosaminyldiphosphoundecaprenol N-acetyl-beta-D-mannosaminyltransferase